MLSFETDDVFEFLRGSTLSSMPLFAIMSIIPILVMMSSPMTVMASNELQVYRMHQYELPFGHHRGCRNSIMNLEARTVHHFKESFARKCVIVKLKYLIERAESFEQLIEETVAAGILILLPQSFAGFSDDDTQKLLNLEKLMFAKDIYVPIYFAFESEYLLQIYDIEMMKSDRNENGDISESNIHKLFKTLIANGHQMVVLGPQTASVKDAVLSNIQGKISGAGAEDQLPTIAFVAHYDSFSVVPGLSFGTDSNGSGVIAILELARLFSKLYANSKTQPKVNLLFLLSSGGKFNYIGTKKWIEEHLDNSESSILSDSLFTVCLDSIGDSENNNGLFMHVSKPPKDGSAAASFYNHLKDVSAKLYSNTLNVTMIHKKINLADESLSWEHERFSIRRLPAFTLSSLSSQKSPRRRTMTDTYHDKLENALMRNIRVIAEATVLLLYDAKELKLFDSDLRVSESLVKSLLSHISNNSRSQSLLLTTQKGSNYELPPLLSSLEYILNKFLRDVNVYHFKIDKNEPEVVFYEPSITTMNVYNVKPAVFDLILSIGIAAYLAIFYLFLVNFHHLTVLIKKER